VDTAGTLELGTETDSCGQTDHGRLVLDRLSLLDGSLDSLEVVVTVLDPDGVPAVGLEALGDVFGESALGVTILIVLLAENFKKQNSPGLTNGNVVVVVDGNQVAKLQVTSSRSSLASNTLHGAAITEEAVCVVVEQGVSGLVENTTAVGLSDSQTNGVGETLTEGTSGHLNTRGVVSLGVAGSDTVELLGDNRVSDGS
jgi:hypothetical protein